MKKIVLNIIQDNNISRLVGIPPHRISSFGKWKGRHYVNIIHYKLLTIKEYTITKESYNRLCETGKPTEKMFT